MIAMACEVKMTIAEKTVSPIAVANYLLKKGDSLTPLKLIKLVYLCHAWYLGYYGVPLLDREVEAWRYGPNFSDLYYAVKDYLAFPVLYPIGNGEATSFSTRQKALIDRVFKVYKGYSGFELTKLTYKQGTPWAEVREKNPDLGVKIDDSLIRQHFEQMAHA